MNTANLRESLKQYSFQLALAEKNPATVKQYVADILQFLSWLEEQGQGGQEQGSQKQGGQEQDGQEQGSQKQGGKNQDGQNKKGKKRHAKDQELDKASVIAYKSRLPERYKPSTVNTKVAALNGFFVFLDRLDLKVKPLKIQHQIFCAKEKELTKTEYDRLVRAAQETGDERLVCILKTICSTGIRVSELQYITVEAVLKGQTTIQLKGKVRPLLLPRKLCQILKDYIRKLGLVSGPIFLTRTGKPLDRSNIWRMMKALCEKARVDAAKVHPHALRHLFARIFYSATKDIAKLADILGHSSINTTRIYIVSTGEEHQRELDDLDLV